METSEIFDPNTPVILKIHTYQHSGFFSCCSIILETIVDFFNKNRRLPTAIDTSPAFCWYKTRAELEQNADIRGRYFKTRDDIAIPYVEPVYFTRDCKTYENGQVQYCDFAMLNHDAIAPFLAKYFTPSDYVMDRVRTIIDRYQIDCDNTVVLFHRGNDKALEMKLPEYEEYVERTNSILAEFPNMKILLQSDETEFLVDMLLEYPNAIICKDHIRYMSKRTNNMEDRNNIFLSLDSYGSVFRTDNPEMSVNFLAIIWIMSRCRFVVSSCGNCQLWAEYFRFRGTVGSPGRPLPFTEGDSSGDSGSSSDGYSGGSSGGSSDGSSGGSSDGSSGSSSGEDSGGSSGTDSAVNLGGNITWEFDHDNMP